MLGIGSSPRVEERAMPMAWAHAHGHGSASCLCCVVKTRIMNRDNGNVSPSSGLEIGKNYRVVHRTGEVLD